MKKISKNSLWVFSFVLINTGILLAQSKNFSSENNECFVGSSFFMLGNLFADSPDYYRLDLAYRLTSKDILILQPLTWKYHAPLGIPYTSKSFESKKENYPGYVRSFGIGIGYNRKIWKNLLLGLYATPFTVKYHDSNNHKTRTGFQLFLQFQTFYRVEFLDKRIYIEPGITCNYWPINTNMPETFKIIEKKWPNYFLFEPVLNFGYNFSL